MGLELSIGVLEAAVFVVAAITAARTLLRGPITREVRSHPRLALLAVGLAAVGLGIAGWLALRSDLARHILSGAIAAGLVVSFVRARPGFGRRRGLPPGSLGLGVSLDAIDDRDFYAKSAERWGPIFKMSQFHRPVACVTDLDTWLEFDAANSDALEQSDWSFNRFVPGGYLEYMNGELHTRYRDRFAPAFTPDAVQAALPTMAAAAREHLAEMHRASQPDGVHPEPFLLPIAQISLLRAVLGVDVDHPQFAQLREYFTDLNRPIELFLPAPRSSQETFRWLASAVSELAAGSVAEASVLGALKTSQSDLANDETAIGNLVLMVKEGGIMVRGMLRWIIKMLADHPDVVAELRAAGGGPRMDALTRAFVHETIRLHESPYLYRSTTRAVDLGGYRVPEGWLVRLCLTEAHANEAAFHEPKRFDPLRFSDVDGFHGTSSGKPSSAFCPFGAGRHACLGGDVASAIAEAVVREAVLSYDIRSVSDGPAWRINRHWGLWRPSLQFQVVLKRMES